MNFLFATAWKEDCKKKKEERMKQTNQQEEKESYISLHTAGGTGDEHEGVDQVQVKGRPF